jgi:hypothetical protein
VPRFRRATVTGVLSTRDGLQRVDTTLGRAYALTSLVGRVAAGEDVILNTTAVDLDLGTGGWHVVHWNLARDELDAPGGGHIMKLRYTGLQADVGAAEEHHPDVPATLEGAPVVACTVHSQVGVVACMLRRLRPDARIAYVMTDGAALPMALSDLVHAMVERGVLDMTLTAGHAFGGDLEAVSVPSALTLARHVGHADAIVVGMGPGVVGTGTALGTTAVEAAAVLDATATLGGRPVLCVRASDADQRDRHRGTSHHTATVLRLTTAAVEAPEAPAEPELDVEAILRELGITITTMGRGPHEDPLFFATAAAAALAAARHVPTRRGARA